jgi:hypothetical protein
MTLVSSGMSRSSAVVDFSIALAPLVTMGFEIAKLVPKDIKAAWHSGSISRACPFADEKEVNEPASQ